MLIDQAFNIGNLYRGGKFEMTDSLDKKNAVVRDIELFISQGRLN